jgi:HEPN domain-containing protein
MRKDAENFLVSAEYDIATAEHMLKTGRYLYVVFLCHLSLEKILKAIVSEATNGPAPRTHNLLHLIKLAGISVPANHFEFISKINNASIVTRYPEDFARLVEVYPEKIVADYLQRTKDVVAWLKQNERLRK